MDKKEEHIDELIAKYLAGEALPDEAILLDEWLSNSESNRQYFDAAKTVFLFNFNEPVDTDAMYRKIISAKQPKRFELKQYIPALRIAASLILVSMIGLVIYRNNKTQPDLIYASTEKVQEQILSDGSQIALNKNAKLTVSGDFNKKQRTVKLEGEAYFEVVHDEQKPFIVDAAGLLIKDIGTAFNVNTNPQGDTVTIFVTEGIVELSANTKTVVLNQNESAVFIKSTQQIIETAQPDNNITAYKTKRFHFTAHTLAQVVQSLNLVYGPIFLLDNKQLESCVISVDFHNDSPEIIANILSETLGLTVEEQNGTYTFKGSSCSQ